MEIEHFSTINRNIEKQANSICLPIPTPDLPQCYYTLGATFGSFTQGDVSVMCHYLMIQSLERVFSLAIYEN